MNVIHDLGVFVHLKFWTVLIGSNKCGLYSSECSPHANCLLLLCALCLD